MTAVAQIDSMLREMRERRGWSPTPLALEQMRSAVLADIERARRGGLAQDLSYHAGAGDDDMMVPAPATFGRVA